MIVIDREKREVLVLLPMGAKAKEILQRLREKGLDFEARPIYCG